MRVIETIAGFRAVLDEARAAGRTVGLVPTMGYLHDGHVSLVEASVRDGNETAVTIFVNPLQFAADEDLSSYPRDLDRDLALCEAAGASVVLAPPVEEMYPRPSLTTVSVAELGDDMEGASRPTHFAGVATVVTKLFDITGPCRAYFGEKDFQQLAIVTRMAADLNQPVEVVGCPIVREPDGVAMSSRNVDLSEDERAAAPVLHRALQAGAAAIGEGETDPVAVRTLMAEVVADEPLAELDYAEVVDPDTMQAPAVLEAGAAVRLLIAAQLGKPRLLDNLGVVVPTD
jgi:pantoate--beta-alanine ligase